MLEYDQRKIKYVKNALEDYYFIMRLMATKLKMLVSYENIYGNNNPRINEEIAQLDREIDILSARTEKVDAFLKKLETEDRIMIYELHKKTDGREHYEDYCFKVGMSRSTLHRHINKIILENWEE